MVNVIKGGGRAVHPPPSPAQPNFTLMTECTPESGRYYSVYSVGTAKRVRKYILPSPPPSVKCNVLRMSLSQDSQNIPCATHQREEGRGKSLYISELSSSVIMLRNRWNQKCASENPDFSPRLEPDLEQSFRNRNNRSIGGFNVSNLMGIKRRMIDISKK